MSVTVMDAGAGYENVAVPLATVAITLLLRPKECTCVAPFALADAIGRGYYIGAVFDFRECKSNLVVSAIYTKVFNRITCILCVCTVFRLYLESYVSAGDCLGAVIENAAGDIYYIP